MLRSLVVLGSLTVSVSAATAQTAKTPAPMKLVTADEVDVLNSANIAFALSRVKPDARGVIFRASEDGRAQYILNRRTSESDIEQHEAWDDLVIVQRGRGVLEYGHSLTKAKTLTKGEQRGGEIGKPRIRVGLEPGTVVRVPARIPHLVRPEPGDSLIYLVVKVKAR